MPTVLLALGSNLGNTSANIERMVELINQHVGKVTAQSRTHSTAPVGFSSPNMFSNAAIVVETILPWQQVLYRTQRIEQMLGRTHKNDGSGYKDRTADIDVIMFDNLVLDHAECQIPHPHFRERVFVLAPLCEDAPNATDPISGKTVRELLHALQQKV